jgi:dTDP-glucose pyrophosphorylase
MIQVVVDNLNIEAHFIFLVQKEHYEKYNLKHLLNLIAPGCNVIQVDGITQGAACSTLLAKEYINNNEPLLMANSDQFVEWNSNEVMYAWSADNIDGGILTFKATHPKWSFAKVDENNRITEVAEKKIISDNATVGIYYFSKGSLFVQAAKQMIKKNIRTRGEYYLCPSYNEIVNDYKIVNYPVEVLHPLGTPEDYNIYIDKFKSL